MPDTLTIEIRDTPLTDLELPNAKHTEPETTITIDDNNHAKITDNGLYPGDTGALPFIRIAIDIGTGITSGVIATWLYNIATKNDAKIKIGRIEISEEQFDETTDTDSKRIRRTHTTDGWEDETYWRREIVIDENDDVETVQQKLEDYLDEEQ